MSDTRLRIGFIQLCDAAALIVAADRGFLDSKATSGTAYTVADPGRTLRARNQLWLLPSQLDACP
jgi:hypothetical protein